MYDIRNKMLRFNKNGKFRILICEDGSVETKHIKLMAIMGDKALRRPDFFEGGLNYFIRNTHL